MTPEEKEVFLEMKKKKEKQKLLDRLKERRRVSWALAIFTIVI